MEFGVLTLLVPSGPVQVSLYLFLGIDDKELSFYMHSIILCFFYLHCSKCVLGVYKKSIVVYNAPVYETIQCICHCSPGWIIPVRLFACINTSLNGQVKENILLET